MNTHRFGKRSIANARFSLWDIIFPTFLPERLTGWPQGIE